LKTFSKFFRNPRVSPEDDCETAFIVS